MHKIACLVGLVYFVQGSLLADEVSIAIDDVVIVSGEQLHADYMPCMQAALKTITGQRVNNSELQLLRQKINTDCFYQRGFINSGMVYPDQSFANNQLMVEVVEGQINELTIRGNHLLPKPLLQDHMANTVKKPLTLSVLRESILLLEQQPAIKKIDARLSPSAELGKARLDLTITDASPYEINIDINNTQRSPSIGDAFFNLRFKHHSISGHGDTFSATLTAAQGLKELVLDYRYPLDARSWLNLGFASARSDVVEQPFDQLDIKNAVDRVELGYEYAVIHKLDQQLRLHTALLLEKSHSSLLGQPFSFSPGVQQGKSRLTIFELGVQWSKQTMRDRSSDHAWFIDARFQAGLPIFSATENDNAPDGEFIKWRFQGQWRKRLSHNGKYQLLLRGNAQWANKTLLPMEVFSFGGINSVRGYRQSRFPRDTGWSASANLAVKVVANTELIPFFDMGQAWNHSDRQTKKLASVGLAIDWAPSKNTRLDAYYAIPLTEKERQGNSLQDKGFGLRFQYWFR